MNVPRKGFDEGRYVDTFPHAAPWKDSYSEGAASDVTDPHIDGSTAQVDVQGAHASLNTAIVSERAAVLREAEELIDGDRNNTYEHPVQNFENIANLWSVQFDHLLAPGAAFTGAHVAQAMAQVKLARMIASPNRDHYVDLAGYAACGWEAERRTDVEVKP